MYYFAMLSFNTSLHQDGDERKNKDRGLNLKLQKPCLLANHLLTT